jgi:hypothetical protein
VTKIATFSLAAALSLALAAPSLAQQAVSSGQARSQTSGQAKTKDAQVNPALDAQAQGSTVADAQSQASAEADAQAQASANAVLEAHKTLTAVKDKGAKVSADARAKADAKLKATAAKTDQEASSGGDARVAARLAAEFGTTADALMAERQALGCSWGELMIAHCLDANTNTEITVSQIFELRKEGTGWGQIAAGLGLKLGDAVSAAQAEARVATGLSKPDGKVAVIHGEGARAGLGANAGANAGLNAGGAQAAARAGAGVGVKIKP